jgi:hypothetical protein
MFPACWQSRPRDSPAFAEEKPLLQRRPRENKSMIASPRSIDHSLQFSPLSSSTAAVRLLV